MPTEGVVGITRVAPNNLLSFQELLDAQICRGVKSHYRPVPSYPMLHFLLLFVLLNNINTYIGMYFHIQQ
eukprot:8873940-Ditylum_brightwellii.AAC.1